MSHCQAARLSDRGVLRVTGTDAHKLLQGIVTNDIGRAADGAAVHTGLLSPQGKILFDFFLVPHDDGFLIEAAKETLPELAKRLGFYRLRAQVEIAEAPEFVVAAVWDGTPELPKGAIAFTDPRLPELGTRVLLSAGTAPSDFACGDASEDDYHALRIALGVPEGGRDYDFGDTFPHEALFDQLNGVDFKKGCFVGQEVVSRMQHRGSTRKRIVPVEGDAPLQSGAEIKAGDLPLGTLGSVSGVHALALLRLDRAQDATSKGTALKCGDAIIKLRRPSFAAFDVPAALPV